MSRIMCNDCGFYCNFEELDVNVKDGKDGIISYKYVTCPNCGLEIITGIKFDRVINFYDLYEMENIDKRNVYRDTYLRPIREKMRERERGGNING